MDCQEYDLVAFGCSFTYGHGLPDCIGEDGVSNGPTPSVLAWPNQLKTFCNFKTVDNQGEPGASNKIITKRINRIRKFNCRSRIEYGSHLMLTGQFQSPFHSFHRYF